MATGTHNLGQINIEQKTVVNPNANNIALTKETGTDKLAITNSSGTTNNVLDQSDDASVAEVEAGTSTTKFLTPSNFQLANAWRGKYFGTLVGVYDHAIHGGAVSTVNLIKPDGGLSDVAYLPNKARVIRSYINCETGLTSAGAATVAVGVESDHAAGILAATAYGSFTTGAFVATINDGATANFTNEATAQRNLVATIGTATLTAGKFAVYVDYWCML